MASWCNRRFCSLAIYFLTRVGANARRPAQSGLRRVALAGLGDQYWKLSPLDLSETRQAYRY